MQALPLDYLSRFFVLKALGLNGPFTVELRALLRERPVSNSAYVELELGIYANRVLVGRRIGVVRPEDKPDRVEDMMGDLLRESVLFGLYTRGRQAQELSDDYPDSHAKTNWLCPQRIGLSDKIEGELTEAYVR